MLLLARLMTAITATLIAVLYGVGEVFEHLVGVDIPFDHLVYDWRLWLAVFAFWASVMGSLCRLLRLHL